MWAVAGAGFAATLAALMLSFFPPAQLGIAQPALYVALLVAGLVAGAGEPLALYHRRRG